MWKPQKMKKRDAWGARPVGKYMMAVKMVASSRENGRRSRAAGIEKAQAGYIWREDDRV